MSAGSWRLTLPGRAANVMFDTRMYQRRLKVLARQNEWEEYERIEKELIDYLEEEEQAQFAGDANIRRGRKLWESLFTGEAA